MKVILSNYRNHWISPYTIIDYVFFWTDWSKCSRNRRIVEDDAWVDHPKWVDKATEYIDPFCRGIQWVLNLVHPRIMYVKLDRWDTWSMDHTLAYIILPMLKQLQETKNGSAMVDDEDVPKELREPKKPKRKKNDVRGTLQVHALEMEDEHSMIHKKWEWVLGEMIWAFEQKVKDDDESEFFDHSAYEKDNGKTNHEKWFEDMSDGKSKLKVDWVGLKAHQERKANGYRLFGKYYEGLWD
jgi:hypothetical protein